MNQQNVTKRLRLDLTGNAVDLAEIIEQNELSICDQLLTAVTHGIKSGTQEGIVILELMTNDQKVYSVETRRPNWIKTLNSCIEIYLRHEIYEKCQECKELIESLEAK